MKANFSIVIPYWLLVFLVICSAVAGAGFGTIMTLRAHEKKQQSAPEGLMWVKIKSIQAPATSSNGTIFYYGCTYETPKGERFFSQMVLGGKNESFLVNPSIVSYPQKMQSSSFQ